MNRFLKKIGLGKGDDGLPLLGTPEPSRKSSATGSPKFSRKKLYRNSSGEDDNELKKRFVPQPPEEPKYDSDEEVGPGGLKRWQTVYDPKRIPKDPPDPWWCVALQALAIIFAVALAGYAYFYFDHMHFHVTHFYADLGYAHAQHIIGHKYLRGKGTRRHEAKAMEYFRKAADQGHPHAAYNLAVGHLQGMAAGLKPGEAHDLIKHAAKHGVDEAHHTLKNICANGGCD